ncbi:MAG: flagellar FliJ family protein [Proteobacteria bacterium]|nr:flagellar FliJ family protein [Pseudomonadota bacterium]
MNRSERMKIVQSIAEHEEREECRAMGESQKNLQDKIGRLEELNTYRQLYAANGKLKTGLHALQWQDYQKFLKRLDQAVAAQEQVVCEGQTHREVHRKRWMVKRQRLESLSRVVDRYKAEESVAVERQLNRLRDSQPIRPGPYDKKH